MLDCCSKHPHEMGVALCGRCGGSWCTACIVYPFGSNKPPFCVSCAMVAGGVRTASARPAMPRRMLKAQMKALRKEAKAVARGAEAPETTPEPELADAAFQSTDWSTPWWEDRQPTLAD